MRGLGASALILLLGTSEVACRAVPAAAGATSTERESPRPMMSGENQASMSFERVLQIAQSKAPDAKAHLEQLRDQGPDDAQLPMLARRILNRWSDSDNTYFSQVPQLLENTCITAEQLKALYPTEVEAKRLHVEIRVDADGKPVRASVIGGTDDKQLKEAVAHSLMQRRYVPAKDHGSYVDATLTIECRVEVR